MAIAQQANQQPVKHMVLSDDDMPRLFFQYIGKLPRIGNPLIQLPDVFCCFEHNVAEF